MSVKGKMFHILLRYRHLMKGRLTAEVIDETTSVEALRKETDEMAARLVNKIEGVQFEESNYSPLYAEWVCVNQAPKEKVILYFHGGGFIMGNAVSHRNIVANFSKRLGINALVFNYRLAPEHPAPAAVYDSAALYCWL